MHDKTLRLGYVGAGFMAQNVHLPNFATLAGCKLTALAEARPRLAAAVAARYNIPIVYSSHLDLAADPTIEAVGISADFAQQGEIAADLLRAGKHVFMEKPMAVSVTQAERIIAAAREGRARLMVGYMKRYDPGNQLMRETIRTWRATGEKGPVLYVRNHGFCGDWLAGLDTSHMITTDEPILPVSSAALLPSWLPTHRVNSYIAYLQQYTHNVNLLRYLLNAQTTRVRVVDLNADGTTGLVVLDLDGVRGVIESGSTTFHQWDEHTQVYFQKGWIHAWAPPFFVKPAQSHVQIYEGGHPSARYTSPIAEPQTAWPYREEAAFFLRALRNDEPFPSSGEDTIADVQLFEEIYRRYLSMEEQTLQ